MLKLCLRAVHKVHEALEIINSDLRCQYTSKKYLEACASYEVEVSMDGCLGKKDMAISKKKHYLRSTIQDVERYLSGGLFTEDR